jgi:hypothetical protein
MIPEQQQTYPTTFIKNTTTIDCSDEAQVSHEVQLVLRLGPDVVVREGGHLEHLVRDPEITRELLIPLTKRSFWRSFLFVCQSTLIIKFSVTMG